VILGQVKMGKFDHNNRMITLSVITLSGLPCSKKDTVFKTVVTVEHEEIMESSNQPGTVANVVILQKGGWTLRMSFN
jgi:hypothetical protein